MAAAGVEGIRESPPKIHSRSNTGCWTCRLRRKKCDEMRGSCLACLSLHLQCAGYGPKPRWMDGGGLEKQMAREIKDSVNKQRKRGRYKVGDPKRLSITRVAPEPAAPLAAAVDSGDCIVLGAQHSVDNGRAEHEHSGPSVHMTVQTDGCLPGITSHLSELQSPILYLPEELHDAECGLQLDNLTWHESDLVWNDIPAQSIVLTPELCLEPENVILDNFVFSPSAPSEAVENPFDRGELTSLFPFFTPDVLSVFRDRMAQLGAGNNTILRSASLAHRTYVQKLSLERLSLCSVERTEQAIDPWRAEALSRIYNVMSNGNDGSQCPDDAVIDVALSLLQLVLLQIRRGVPDHDDLAGLMRSLYDRCRRLAAAGDQVSAFVSSVILSIEILGSASLRRPPLLTAGPVSIGAVDFAVLDMAGATGSEAWVFQCIAETTLLRSWKQESVASQTLNVAELVRRAIKLEQDLEKNLQEMERRSSSAESLTVPVMTRIYAAAAKAYLHVVVSGANPEVEDIVSAVDAAVKALQTLSHASLIRRLSWPICVIASLAKLRHNAFFTTLEAGARGDQDECTSVLRAFEVARETQRLRRMLPGKEGMIDWVDGMESLGHEWILL